MDALCSRVDDLVVTPESTQERPQGEGMKALSSSFGDLVVTPDFGGRAPETAQASLKKTLTSNIFDLEKRYFLPDLPTDWVNDGHMAEYKVEYFIRHLPCSKNGNFFCFLGLELKEIEGNNARKTSETDFLLLHPQLGAVLIKAESIDQDSSIAHIARIEAKGQEQLNKAKEFFKTQLEGALILDDKDKLADFVSSIPAYVAMPNATEVVRTGDAELLLQPFFDGGVTAETTLFKATSDIEFYVKLYPWMLNMCYHLKSFNEDPAGINVGATASMRENLAIASQPMERDAEVPTQSTQRTRDPENIYMYIKSKYLKSVLESLKKTVTSDIFNLTKTHFVRDVTTILKHQGEMTEYQVDQRLRNLPDLNGHFFCFPGLKFKRKEIEGEVDLGLKFKRKKIEGDFDFLLIHPRMGVAVIEVKNVAGNSTIMDNNFEKGLKQLEKAKEFLEIMLNEEIKPDETEKKELSKFIKEFPTYLALPNVTERKPSGNAELLLKSFFDGTAGKTTLFKAPSNNEFYQKLYPLMLTMCYDLYHFKKGSSGIDIGATASSSENIATTSKLLEDNEREITQFCLRELSSQGVASSGIYHSPQQLALLDPFYASRMPKELAITGNPGTGKTHILAEKMRQLLLEDPENKCVFIGGTVLLVENIRKSMVKSNLKNKNWRCISTDEFLSEVCSSLGCEITDSKRLKTLIRKNGDKTKFSDYHIFFDEFQDVDESDTVYNILLKWCNRKDRFTWVAYDNNQRSFPSTKGKLVVLPTTFKVITLPAVYRMPPEVFHVVNSLIPREKSVEADSSTLAMAIPIANRNPVEFRLVQYECVIAAPSPSRPDDLEKVIEKLTCVYECLVGGENVDILSVKYLCDDRSASEILVGYLTSLLCDLHCSNDYAPLFKEKGLGRDPNTSKVLQELENFLGANTEPDKLLVEHALDYLYRDQSDFNEKQKSLRDLLESCLTLKNDEIDENLVQKYAKLLVGKGVGNLNVISNKIKDLLLALIRDEKIDFYIKELSGDLPGWLGDSDPKREKLSDLLVSLMNVEGIPGESITVLEGHSKKPAEWIKAICDKYGVRLATVDQFKGLDSSVIIAIFGVSYIPAKDGVTDIDDWAGYRLAFSRTKFQLFVITTVLVYPELYKKCNPKTAPAIRNVAPPNLIYTTVHVAESKTRIGKHIQEKTE